MGWSFHAVFLGGVIFAAYSHFSGWWLCVPVVAIMAGLSYRRFRHGRPYRADAAVMLGGLVLVGLPLLLADWGVPFFVKVLTTPAMKEHAQSVMGINQLSAFSMTWQIGTAMGWGDTALRSCFLVGSLLALPVALYLRPLQRRKAGVVLFVTVVAMVIYLAANKQQGAYFARRHASLVLPGFLILAAYALWEVRLIGRRLTGVSRKAWTVGWGLVLATSLLLNMRPAVACARLDGNPSPYTRIRDWIEAELPAGTVVLVDRWLEPWNELRHYAPSNAQYTFTVPNEPWTAYLQNRWRESVVGFFEKYPEAAYMPLCGSYTNDPNLGTWDWPDKHFARRHSITNAEGFILRDLGLAYREDFYTVGWTRLVADIFYNTRADVIAAARASGRPTLALCGPGWGYTKLWRQMPGDFRDWRVLGDRATVDLYNLTAAPTNVTLAVRAVAVGAATRVRASTGADQFFPAGQLQDWSIRGIVLQPGSNAVQLVRAGHGGPNAAVLVEAIRVQ
jgi:hypothetical protein